MRKKYPVVEIFGPTIQGEGIDQGVPCHFVRFGGCDYKCDWCDSPHAVLASAVRRAPQMSPQEIAEKVDRLCPGPSWVILSGGNPLLYDLEDVVIFLHRYGYKVAVETQGTRYKDWVGIVDRLCLSPKPPSSGMKGEMHVEYRRLLEAPQGLDYGWVFLKVVVFDYTDYEYARTIRKMYPEVPMFVSAGNDAGATVGNPSRKDSRTPQQVATALLDKTRWLANNIMVDTDMQDVRVQSQAHVLLWGNELGR